MKERPILFSGDMVNAILSGQKTQTRRIIKPQPDDNGAIARDCPFGYPGDRLWVREAFWKHEIGTIFYRADHNPIRSGGKWKPSIHMPRWASRIDLEIISLRTERLRDITHGDCMLEGCPFPNMADGPSPYVWFADLWESINGAGSFWDANRYVWVIEFKKL